MDVMKELYEMKETVGQKIADANKKIRAAGGKMDSDDIEIVDELAHSFVSLVKACEMLKAEEEGYSGYYGPTFYPGMTGYSGRENRNRYSRENREGYSGENREGYSGENRWGYSGRENREGRYSGENRNRYSRKGDTTEQLYQMMDEAPDEMTRKEIRKLIDKLENQQ